MTTIIVVGTLTSCRMLSKVKASPHDRRIIMSAWSPRNFAPNGSSSMPCILSVLVSFPTLAVPGLSCLLYQRSCDMGLGVPFNIASYALLTKMIAHIVDMDCGEFIQPHNGAMLMCITTTLTLKKNSFKNSAVSKLYIKEGETSDHTNWRLYVFRLWIVTDPYGP